MFDFGLISHISINRNFFPVSGNLTTLMFCSFEPIFMIFHNNYKTLQNKNYKTFHKEKTTKHM